MASQVSRGVVLNLYRGLLKNARSWNNYNFKEYIQRRVKEDFASNKLEVDPTRIESLITKAKENLELVKRQGIIQNIYNQDKLVLEVKKDMSKSAHPL
jgi:hypothetical protein